MLIVSIVHEGFTTRDYTWLHVTTRDLTHLFWLLYFHVALISIKYIKLNEAVKGQ
jgi:hypothetical protein